MDDNIEDIKLMGKQMLQQYGTLPDEFYQQDYFEMLSVLGAVEPDKRVKKLASFEDFKMMTGG